MPTRELPVPAFHRPEEAFGRWREAGMHLLDTATPLSQWPGFASA